MDFEEAISVHSAWKMRLKSYLMKPDQSLKPMEVAADDRCALGKWLQSEKKKHAAMPEFGKLCADHSRFHQIAADILRRADAGEKVIEETAIGARSEFSSVSSAVVTGLLTIQKKLQMVHSH